MSSFRWIRVLGGSVFLVSLVAALYAAISAFGGKSHLSGSDCASCHLSAQDVKPEKAANLVATQEALCAGCHPDAARLSHPSGFQPKTALPAEYPLDWKGDLTCSTCHQIHGSEHGLMRGSKRGKEMCLSCHDSAFFANMKDAGGSIEQSGHLTAGVKLGNVELDAYSLHCMGCHGGHAGSEGVSVDRNGVVRHASGSANHPIGKRYRESFKSGRFRHETRLSKKILLPDGKISCVSCHQAYKKDHGKLVISNRGSALCFECHDI